MSSIMDALGDRIAAAGIGIKTGKASSSDEPVPFDAMVQASEIVYSFAGLRSIVKENKGVPFVKPELVVTQDGTRDLEARANAYLKYPVSYNAILEFIQSNRKFLLNDDGYFVFNEDWKTAKPDTELEKEKARLEVLLEVLVEHYDAEIWEFDDSMPKDDLVYGCVVNRSDKRVTLVFRGSVTLNDWLTDFDMRSDEPKDLSLAKEQKIADRDIRIHRGFSEYLFGIDKGETKSKYTEILEDLSDIYNYKKNGRDYSDYRLFITGHSLGGALAQLLAFTLALNHEKTNTYNTPVTSVTYASPRVGMAEFRDAHVALEKKKLLRHVRVSNNKDIICTAPPRYVQTGVNVHIYDDGTKADVEYNVTKSLFSQFSLTSSAAAHMISNYNKNVTMKDKDGKMVNDELFQKSVKDLYKDYAKIDA